MLPEGADNYGLTQVPAWLALGAKMPAWGKLSPRARAVRMGDHHDPGFFWYSPASECVDRSGSYGRLYPPPEAIRGPFMSPAHHLRLGQEGGPLAPFPYQLGDDVSPGAPATSMTYPDILTSGDQVSVPALSPIEPWTPAAALPALRSGQSATYGPTGAALGGVLGTDWTTLALYAAGGLAVLFLITRLGRR